MVYTYELLFYKFGELCISIYMVEGYVTMYLMMLQVDGFSPKM